MLWFAVLALADTQAESNPLGRAFHRALRRHELTPQMWLHLPEDKQETVIEDILPEIESTFEEMKHAVATTGTVPRCCRQCGTILASTRKEYCNLKCQHDYYRATDPTYAVRHYKASRRYVDKRARARAELQPAR